MNATAALVAWMCGLWVCIIGLAIWTNKVERENRKLKDRYDRLRWALISTRKTVKALQEIVCCDNASELTPEAKVRHLKPVGGD